jgi:hypothetical protein
VAASLSVVAILATARAHAEHMAPEGPPRAFTWTTSLTEPVLRTGMSMGPFMPLPVLSLGVWRRGSFRWSPGPTLANETRSLGLALCVTCELPHMGVDVDPRTATPTASRRAIEAIGPIGSGALALFASPVPTRASPVVMRVLPMFALGGGGLELRGGWW